MTRTIETEKIADAARRIISRISFVMPEGVLPMFSEMKKVETSPLAEETLSVLEENARIAEAQQIPLCQDCGVVIFFIEVGHQVMLQGPPLQETLDNAVAEVYEEKYLRKSVVDDPLNRNNTGTNTPSFIHYEQVEGDAVTLTVLLKGGGSENMTSLRMFRPTDSVDEIIEYIADVVRQAGPNPCPPLFLGVGIGGTADLALVNAKKAVLRGPGSSHPAPFYDNLEKQIMERLNTLNVGPLGLGGKSTCAGVFIREAPTHIATLPVALNLNCHSLRFGREEI